jgi:hypothetical protein
LFLLGGAEKRKKKGPGLHRSPTLTNPIKNL